MSFYNTINELGQQLDLFERQAETQEEKIYMLFQQWEGRPLTPHEVLEMVGFNAPITSIRRAITNLTSRGLIEKTSIKKNGPYGKPSYSWRLS